MTVRKDYQKIKWNFLSNKMIKNLWIHEPVEVESDADFGSDSGMREGRVVGRDEDKERAEGRGRERGGVAVLAICSV